jgi:hypothetical protein
VREWAQKCSEYSILKIPRRPPYVVSLSNLVLDYDGFRTHGSFIFPPSRAQGCRQTASRFPGSAAAPRSSSISVTGPGGVKDTSSLSPDGNSRILGNIAVMDRSKAAIVGGLGLRVSLYVSLWTEQYTACGWYLRPRVEEGKGVPSKGGYASIIGALHFHLFSRT